MFFIKGSQLPRPLRSCSKNCSVQHTLQTSRATPKTSSRFATAGTRRDGLTDHNYLELVQLEGRAGRKSTLEDGERMLWRCIYYRHHAIPPRLLLCENLLLQGRGREKEVPELVVRALSETPMRGCGAKSVHADQAIRAVEKVGIPVQLGLTAMQRAGREKSAMQRFLNDATRHVPDLKQAVRQMASGKNFLVETSALSDFDALD